MNIIEAIKSGKPFKRKCWGYWHHTYMNSQYLPNEIISDDWEIQEETIPVTRSQMYEVIKEILKWSESKSYPYTFTGPYPLNKILKDLGFKE